MNKIFLYTNFTVLLLLLILLIACGKTEQNNISEIEKQKSAILIALDSIYIANGADGSYILFSNQERTKAKSMTASRFYENTKYHKEIGELLLENVYDSLNFSLKNYKSDEFTYVFELKLMEKLQHGGHPEVAGLFEMSTIVSNGEKSAVYVATHTGESNFYIIVLKKVDGKWVKDTVARIMSSNW